MDTLPFTAIVLSGGESSRMKTEKGLVSFRGKAMIQHVLETVSKVTNKVILIANHPGYQKLGYPCFPDIFSGVGPLGGIYSGLIYSTTRKNLVLSCDMPFITTQFLETFMNMAGEEDILVPVHEGKPQPLCAVYDQHCREELKARIGSGKLKLQDLFEALKTKRVHVDSKFADASSIFTNINTPEDLIRYQNQKV